MLDTNVKIAIRGVTRQKLFSGINILGLAVGITACMLILMYVRDELSYDNYHPYAERTARIAVEGALGGNKFEIAVTPAPMAAAMLADYPEVEYATRVSGIFGYPVIRYGDRVFSEERWTAMDSTAFDVFALELVRGDPQTALSKPNQVVITESTARRYFGDEDPMGKILNSDRRRDFEVSGVIKDFPHNSHMHYDFIASMVSYDRSGNNMWVSNNFYTYVVLREGYTFDDLEAKLPETVNKYVGPQVEQFLGVSWQKLVEDGTAYRFFLQPLTDIHLTSHLDAEIEVNGSYAYVYTFTLIALFILLLAAINYMNLATARSAHRAKEVGVRKTLGSRKSQLVRQFLTESIVFALLGSLVAALMIGLSLPWFNNLLGLELTFDPVIVPLLIGIALVVGLLAGTYPAFFLSSFNAAEVLLGSKSNTGTGSKLRSGLVIFQFTVSIVLFSGALLVTKQLDHMQNKPLGFVKDNMLVVEKTDDIGADIQPFMKALANNANILAVSNSTAIPGARNAMGASVFGIVKEDGEDNQLLITMTADWDFADVYGIKMVKGRYYDTRFASDSQAVVINAAAARAYGIADPVGMDLTVIHNTGEDKSRIPIIGVIDDFHYESLHKKVRPLVIFPMGSPVHGRGTDFGKFVTARINPGDLAATLDYVERTWKEFANDQALEYVFLDDHLATQYAGDVRTKALMSVFTVLAIFIASLGLLGLAAFSAEQRTKEIGIRKVLGASGAQIFIILSRDIMSLVLVAVGLSLPISYYVLNRWLQDFAYRVEIPPQTFLVAGLGALAIALITISYQVLRASLSNPINALRYE
ncbi:MAG: ABC transporter permease [Candidatus Marinimicrobia bacterium]|nr:ABC transporter permease [Candidatus Neomarinimicrobiota bacterium]